MTFEDIKESALMAVDTLRANKLRSALTILGVSVGVVTVIFMVSIIQGLNKAFADQIESLGSNTIFVSKFAPSFGRPPGPLRRLAARPGLAGRGGDAPGRAAGRPARRGVDAPGGQRRPDPGGRRGGDRNTPGQSDGSGSDHSAARILSRTEVLGSWKSPGRRLRR